MITDNNLMRFGVIRKSGRNSGFGKLEIFQKKITWLSVNKCIFLCLNKYSFSLQPCPQLFLVSVVSMMVTARSPSSNQDDNHDTCCPVLLLVWIPPHLFLLLHLVTRVVSEKFSPTPPPTLSSSHPPKSINHNPSTIDSAIKTGRAALWEILVSVWGGNL